MLPLPRTRGDGARVTLHILNEVDASEHVAQHLYRMIFMVSDIRMVEEAEISGDVFVFDAANVGVSIVLKHAGSLLKKALTLAQVGAASHALGALAARAQRQATRRTHRRK